MDGGRAGSTRDYGEKSEKPLSSLLVFLNDWLNFRVRDQFEIEMLIARGHRDINTTLFVIMSLFCCRSLCLCISGCLFLFILAMLALSPVCLPAFFTIILSPSSRPESFYLPTFFTKILSSFSTSSALSLAIVFACSTRVDSCSLPFTFSLLSA